MFKKLNEITSLADAMSTSEFQLLMNKWDDKLTDYMLAAEDQCRKYCMNHIDYSPEANAWLRRRWLLGQVYWYLDGKVPDPRNLFRSCERHGLGDQRKLTKSMVDAEVLICLRKIEELKLKAPEMQQQHLNDRL